MENKVLEEQLLARAMQEPALTKQVLSRNASALLSNEMDVSIANILIKYYNGSSVPISDELLQSRLQEYLSRLNARKARNNQDELSDEEMNAYANRAREIYNIQPDMSAEMADDLDSYVKDTLTTSAILADAMQGEANLASRVAKHMEEIKELSVKGNVTKPIDVYDDLEARNKVYSEEFVNNRTPFGLEPLDRITRGGLRSKEVMLIGAPSGKGKTTILSNLSYYFSFVEGQNVLHISLEELSSNQLVRFDRLAGNAGVNDIYNRDGTIKPEFVSKMNGWLSKQKGKHGMLRYIASMPNTLTVDDIRQQIISTERETGKKIQVLTLDYADLLRKNYNSAFSEAQVGEMLYQDLSKLAHEQDLVLLTGTQLNRTSGDNDVKTLQSIEGSFRKINIISLGLTINANEQEYQKGYVRLYIDKARSRFEATDDFIYLKYNLKNMLLVEETPQELAEHKAISGRDGSKGIDVKKADKNQSMDEAITAGINESLAKAFS